MRTMLACLLYLPLAAVALDVQVSAKATLAEKTAAHEISAYLGRMTGTVPMVRAEGAASAGRAIFVGDTAVARAMGIEVAKLADEEWIVRSVDQGVVVAGGGSRGTLYAAYHYLEDACGVRWWNPWEEHVPRLREAPLLGLQLSGKPGLQYRDIYMLYGGDGGRFAARSRLNREGDARISPDYGGCRDYGPPYHVHTFYMYIPPKTYFADHPEYFSLVGGKRQADRHQLCLSNPEVRKLFITKLKAYIADREEKAKAAGTPPPVVYDISQNDWGGQCQCDACQVIVKREGDSEAGLLLDFINEIADAIKADYPYVYIDTLAYQYTQKPPATVRPRDNTIIRLCDTRSNATFPITAEENTPFREFLLTWSGIAKNLRIWDYAVTYAPPRGLPYPSVHTYAEDFRFYAEHHVEGVFTELEYPVTADVRDYKVWLMAKLLENPYADTAALANDFCSGFYGPAGTLFRDYRALLRNSQSRKRAYIGMGPSISSFTFLDFATVSQAQKLFDQGEGLLAGDPVRLARWHHARLSLDRATCARWRSLMGDWTRLGRPAADLPLDRGAIVKRIREAWTAQAGIRLAGKRRELSLAQMESELTRYSILPLSLAPPTEFAGIAPGRIHDYTADLTRNWRDIVQVVKDPESESGIANRLAFPNSGGKKHVLAKYKLPMPWGLYTPLTKTFNVSAKIEAKDVPAPGYHWYKFGTHPVGTSTYFYFFWSWIIQLDVDDAMVAEAPETRYDIWARIKFTGPDFPHGKADDANAIYVERVVLVHSEKK
ncbi:MAG: DUF4838 domain-containing protein [Victivallales bacterium]|nr:DUF4838 domain-containing protein [Victivallales bacterium]